MLAAVTRREEQSLQTLSWALGSALNAASSHARTPLLERNAVSTRVGRQTRASDESADK